MSDNQELSVDQGSIILEPFSRYGETLTIASQKHLLPY